MVRSSCNCATCSLKWSRRGNLVHAHTGALLATWPTFPGLRRAPTPSVAFSRELWKLPLLPAGPNEPQTPRIASLFLPELALSPVLELVGEVSPESQTLRSEHCHTLLVPPPSVELELELQQEPPLGSCAVERDLRPWAVGALMVLSAIVLFFLRTADLQAADERAPGANKLKVVSGL